MTNLVGTTLGQYQIVELIGEGQEQQRHPDRAVCKVCVIAQHHSGERRSRENEVMAIPYAAYGVLAGEGGQDVGTSRDL